MRYTVTERAHTDGLVYLSPSVIELDLPYYRQHKTVRDHVGDAMFYASLVFMVAFGVSLLALFAFVLIRIAQAAVRNWLGV